jgi:repressor LexA
MAKFTNKQGQYLAYIHLYRKLHRQGPSEADLVRFFHVSPPTVHQMIIKLEQLGLITREPGVPRSARVTVASSEIPELEDVGD